MNEGREAFERWYFDLVLNPLSHAYNNPLGMPVEGDMQQAMWLGWQAALNHKGRVMKPSLEEVLEMIRDWPVESAEAMGYELAFHTLKAIARATLREMSDEA